MRPGEGDVKLAAAGHGRRSSPASPSPPKRRWPSPTAASRRRPAAASSATRSSCTARGTTKCSRAASGWSRSSSTARPSPRGEVAGRRPDPRPGVRRAHQPQQLGRPAALPAAPHQPGQRARRRAADPGRRRQRPVVPRRDRPALEEPRAADRASRTSRGTGGV